MPVAVSPYETGWPVRFAAEADRLVVVLRPWLAGPVEHVGSTAVPGLAAKPVIDMVAPIRSLAEAVGAVEPLRALGYGHAEHRPDALWFYAPEEAIEHWQHAFHLHLTEPAGALWRERLAFRDALRSDDVLRERYAQLKRQLLAASPDGYTAAGKRTFVKAVLAGRGVALD